MGPTHGQTPPSNPHHQYKLGDGRSTASRWGMLSTAEADLVAFRGPFQPQPFCDSTKVLSNSTHSMSLQRSLPNQNIPRFCDSTYTQHCVMVQCQSTGTGCPEAKQAPSLEVRLGIGNISSPDTSQGLVQTAQGSGGVPIPRGIQGTWGCGTWG